MTIQIIAAIIAIFGLFLFIQGIRRCRRKKIISGSLQGLSGLLLLSLAAFAVSIAFNLYSYQQLTHEQKIAECRFTQLGPQLFRIFITTPNQLTRSYELRGDQWQIDARVIKWNGVANLAGMKTLYQLDRINGRYQDIIQEHQAPRSVFQLADNSGLDIWQLARQNKQWLPWLDAVYGSAAYLPMQDDAIFIVSVTTSGLLARAKNETAKQAIEHWK